MIGVDALTLVGVIQVPRLATTFLDDASSLGGFAFLLLFQLFGGFFTQQKLHMTTT